MNYTDLTEFRKGFDLSNRSNFWCMTCSNVPNQSASRVAYQAKEHQETNEYIKEQQAKVSQPPVNIHIYSNNTKSREGGSLFGIELNNPVNNHVV